MSQPVAVAEKHYTSPFVLDKGKLSRIFGIIETHVGKEPSDIGFEIVLKSGKSIIVQSPSELIALDNAVANPIVSLTIHAAGPVSSLNSVALFL